MMPKLAGYTIRNEYKHYINVHNLLFSVQNDITNYLNDAVITKLFKSFFLKKGALIALFDEIVHAETVYISGYIIQNEDLYEKNIM